MIAQSEVVVDPNVASNMLQHVPEFFIQFFLSEQLSRPVPDFHKEIFYEMTHDEVRRLVLAVPRAHAKTTLAKLCCVWYLLFSDYRFVLYVSGSHDLVVPYVNDIAAFFEHPNYIAIFGPVEWIKKQDGIGVYKFRLGHNGKICILRGLGAGQRIRGINVDNVRPQLAVVDDAEDDEDVSTPQMHDQMVRWWAGPFLKCLDQFDNKLIVSGNLLSARSLLYKLLQSDGWRSFLYGAIKNDKTPLWPEMWSLEKLREDFLQYQELGQSAKWFAEMMNQPVPTSGGIVKADEITYAPPRNEGDIEYGFVTLDPAISDQKWANRACIAAHAWIADEQQWQIVEIKYWRGIDPSQLFMESIQMMIRWRFRVCGVEGGAMQSVLQHLFSHLQLVHNLSQYKFLKLETGNRSKTDRIAAWASMLKTTEKSRARYTLTQGDYICTQQLIMYDPQKKDNDDDIADCCAYGPQMTSRYMAEIMQQINHLIPQQINTMYQIASC